jgi:nitroreductase
MRLFIAINFNTDTRNRLIALQEELRTKSQSGNFSRDENLHLTLAFIGEVSPNKLIIEPGKEITPEQLDALLEAAIWAPCGSNSQSWLFTAIQNADVLAELNAIVREGFISRYTPDDDYSGKHGVKEYAKREDYNFYYHAPTLIIASNRPNYQNAMADCALALENIFLAAESFGLGTCYINQLFWLRNDPVLREYLYKLGISKERVICSAAAVGHIGKGSAPLPRKDGTINIIREEISQWLRLSSSRQVQTLTV